MRNKKVYDFPTRTFHWTFAALFVAAFSIAKICDLESPNFPIHAMLGVTLGVAVILRILWGIVGSHYAKWSSFQWRPTLLMSYIRDLRSRVAPKYLGHNPASSWGTFAMLGLGSAMVVTGIMMSLHIYKKALESVHEIISYVFVATVIVHIAGILLHQFQHKDGIGMSMVDGKKVGVAQEVEISRQYPLVALAYLVLLLSCGLFLAKHFDLATRSVVVSGVSFELGDVPEPGARSGNGSKTN